MKERLLGQQNEVILKAKSVVHYHKRCNDRQFRFLDEEDKGAVMIKYFRSLQELAEAVDELENMRS